MYQAKSGGSVMYPSGSGRKLKVNSIQFNWVIWREFNIRSNLPKCEQSEGTK